MQGWTKIVVAALPATLLLIIIIFFIHRWCSSKQRREFEEATRRRAQADQSLQSGITRLRLAYENGKINHRSQAFRRGSLSVKPFFNWADHPSLITEAVEHGWSRFAFTGNIPSSSPSTRSALLGLCAPYDLHGRERGVEISWEVCSGSADFVQKLRLNSGLVLKKNNSVMDSNPSLSATYVTKTALPLPGPHLGNSSFPQEAYFEITILSCRGDGGVHAESIGKDKENRGEGEKAKLIRENIDQKNTQSDSLVHVASNGGNNRVDEYKEESKSNAVMLSLGLTVGGSLPSKLPGAYPRSIGFNSDGSVYLDGIKLAFETEKSEWARAETVIGCGFNPSLKKVFFTVNSELLHVIHCKSDEFSTPLYPTLAANMDVTVLVNFGQSAFKYAQANAQRTANPCFTAPLASATTAQPALGYEDSRELFSMGRIDAEWLNRCTTKSSHQTFSDKGTVDFDEESENEFFEIVLDNWRSPSQSSWNKV
ncbi:hypothetical protein Sjap_022844 [Stephania japonica]|uniref:B30.2/SPRY domain-containing protein n=1 Tax=Stephania japonica TaxID=461633 RepID=A0AAP0HU01_9MAGN